MEQFDSSVEESESLGAATEKRRAAVSKLCGGTDRSLIKPCSIYLSIYHLLVF